jgi:hypothetical protein
LNILPSKSDFDRNFLAENGIDWRWQNRHEQLIFRCRASSCDQFYPHKMGKPTYCAEVFYIAQQQASALYFGSSKERCDKILLSCQAWNPHNCAHVTFFNQKGGRDERHCNFRTI